MPYTTLVTTEALATLIDSPDVAIIDCRFDLANTSAGEAAYTEGHIPGAVYAHLDRDLSAAKTGTNGRHPLPSPEVAAATFGRLGIGPGVQVVAYDQDSGMFASRLWWMLRWLGHDAVAVLDGGFARWRGELRPVTTTITTPVARTFTPSVRSSMTVSADDVAHLAASADVRLVDARAPERFRGEQEQIDPVAGHIPGALNHFFGRNLAHGHFKSPDELREGFDESFGNVPGDRIVCYCGSGVTACHNVLALEHAGFTGVRLYPGSWSEWIADPSRGVEKG
ncbi:MAG: sulfurtransferase [Vicinamibacterales bacterium]